MHSLFGPLIFNVAVLLRGEGSMFSARRLFERSQWAGELEIRAEQRDRLASLLRWAGAQCTYYRRYGGDLASATPDTAFGILAHLPFLSKVELQESQDLLVAPQFRDRTTRKTTGGSTGQAVTVLKDRRSIGFERAASIRGNSWVGVSPGDRGARWWGVPYVSGRRWRNRLVDFVANRRTFSAFAFTDADLKTYLLECTRLRPTYFYGYVSMLEAFAQYLHRCGYNGRDLRLNAIITTSEVLSPVTRSLLKETFGCPVQNEYGCGEVGPIAYECEHGGLHISAENLLVEVLDSSGGTCQPGQSGEIVVTDLNNRAMPLIRYRLGDFAEVGEQCICGRGLPTLAGVWGRAYDTIVAADGRAYHGEYFMYLFEDLREAGIGIRQFQVVQRPDGSLDVLIANPAPLTRDQATLIRQRLLPVAGANAVTVREVPDIPREASGKLRVIVRQTARSAGG